MRFYARRSGCGRHTSRSSKAEYVVTSVGKTYAYRERARTPDDPVRPVEVVKEGPPRSQKVKVRRLDGEYEGLEEWVPEVRLVAPWEDAGALLEDERRMFEALEASDDVYGTVPYEAVEMVFGALPFEPKAGEEMYLGYKAVESELLVIENLDATAGQLGLSAEELRAEPHAYVDRFGQYKAPFGVAVAIAEHCCKRFARDVLRYVKAEEDALKEAIVSRYYAFPNRRHWSSRDKDGFEILRERAEEWLGEQEPVFALIRGWCGEEAVEEFDQVLELREEVDRLGGIVRDTARWLRFSGHPVKAALLLKDLGKASGPKDRTQVEDGQGHGPKMPPGEG